MTAQQAYNARAVLVYTLRKDARYSLDEVRRILRLASKEDVRKLEGRVRWLRRQSETKIRKLYGCDKW